MMVFTGNSNRDLDKKVARRLYLELGSAKVDKFSDGEVTVELNENVRGKDVFVLQSTCEPTNDNLMELLLIIDALRRASASRITAVVPYFGYARQDRRVRSARVPISSKVVAEMMVSVGVDRVLTVDLHAEQIQGFFTCPVDNVYGSPILNDDIVASNFKDVVVVSPDIGGVVRARAIAKQLDDADLAIIDKRRPRANESEVMNLIGDVEGRTAIMVDDMVDTAGTLTKAADLMIEKGAESVIAICTHALLSGDAYEKIEKSKLKKLITSDSIEIKNKSTKVEYLTCSKIFAEAMFNVHNNKSIDKLFIN